MTGRVVESAATVRQDAGHYAECVTKVRAQGRGDGGLTTQQRGAVSAPTTAAGIPLSLRPFFQEYHLESLDPSLHSGLVIERVLAYGDRGELRWLFGYYGRPRIVGWVRQVGARRLPWRRYNLWCVLLDLPRARHPHAEGRRVWPH